MRTVTLNMTVTGPEDALTRLAHSLSQVQSAIEWELNTPNVRSTSEPPITIDTRSHRVFVAERAVMTTKREYDLLLFFAQHPESAFTRAQLMKSVWGHEESGERTVDVHIRRLRHKLGRYGDDLVTVRGHGYRMAAGTIAIR